MLHVHVFWLRTIRLFFYSKKHYYETRYMYIQVVERNKKKASVAVQVYKRWYNVQVSQKCFFDGWEGKVGC